MIEYKIGTILFNESFSPICHCIAKDRKMGAGFAKQVPEEHKRLAREAFDENIGGVIRTVGDDGLNIFHLITKKESKGKPTWQTYRKALNTLENYCLFNDIDSVNCPMMGAGLDGLNWDTCEKILKKSELKFVVWVLDNSWELHKLRAKGKIPKKENEVDN